MPGQWWQVAGAWHQVGYWRNSTTLFEHALQVTAKNYVAHNNLGVALVHEERFEEAMAQYTEAHNNLGNLYKRGGRLDDAIKEYQTAIALNPNDAETYNSFGVAYQDLDRLDEAIHAFEAALAIQPDHKKARQALHSLQAATREQ